MRCFVTREIDKSRQIMEKLLRSEQILSTLETIAEVCVDSLHNGGKIIVCGNGTSASNGQHLAGHLGSRVALDRPGLASMALNPDTAVISSHATEDGEAYDKIYARQVDTVASDGDVLIGLSACGNTPNVLESFRSAREKDITCVGFTGGNGGQMSELCDYVIIVPDHETPRIQEGHMVLGHILCGILESAMYPAEEEAMAG